MSDEQARPLTAEELEALRADLDAQELGALRSALDAQAEHIRELLASLGARDATLDAWRPVLEAVAGIMYWDHGQHPMEPYDAQVSLMTIMDARRLLGQE